METPKEDNPDPNAALFKEYLLHFDFIDPLLFIVGYYNVLSSLLVGWRKLL
jgi:hypothetical protein